MNLLRNELSLAIIVFCLLVQINRFKTGVRCWNILAALSTEKQCSELHVRHHFWSVWTADAAFLRGFGPTVSSGLYPIRKCPQSGPRTWGLGGDLDRLNHRPLATSAA